MAPREYRMARRADSSEETRRRIVEATAQLHMEKGIAATTYRDIAQRADVGLGTVYHHFPTYDHVVAACGAHTLAAAHPPQVDIFEGAGKPAARVRILVRELFAFYSRLPAFDTIRAERRAFAPVDQWFRQEEQQRRAFIHEALRGVRAGVRARSLVFATLDFCVYHSLVSSGLSRDAAVDEITTVILNRLNLRSTK